MLKYSLVLSSRTCKACHPVLVSARGYRRLKAGTGSTADARDAALIKKLQSQLEELKKKIADEEEDAHTFLERHASGEQAKADKQHQYTWFWEKALSDGDRQKLASLSIKSLDDLQAAYHEADVAMTTPPFPKPEQLQPRLRIAHDLHMRIPEKIAAARRQSSLSRLNLKKFWGGMI
ncbi:hypothetical protein BDP27DRAFT_1313320 [Rhodocollybia butyracea]|uniref:Uncharacterized protein n=1 Tax=Rhodocollybia butyracea TaxID=206335 RepID=A0A9P5Q7V4_9AGAR|nr:hypothetical protein BDP27DRAFT_1313320 [Rhodocollybia butyracea]